MSDNQNQFRTVKKWVLGLAGTLLLGALGSGLWEIALRDPVIWSGTKLLGMVAFVWSGYLDTLYSYVGSAYTDYLTTLPFVLSVVVLTCGPVFASWTLYGQYRSVERQWKGLRDHLDGKENDRSPPSPSEIERRGKQIRSLLFRLLFPITAIATAMALFLGIQSMYVRRVVNWLDRSIEIVAPQLAPVEILRLRSEFRSISDARTFFAFETKVKTIAASNHIALPIFEPVGRNPNRNP
jgi:hypothetical protein